MREYQEGGLFHIYNRGVDKRKIFLDENDYSRFVDNLYEFNDKNPFIYSPNRLYESKEKNNRVRDVLVDIFCFVLMPNHFHLLVKTKGERDMVEFMKKINGGYTLYFNQKYERTGALFEGRYKSVRVSSDRHLLHLPYYIHANPLNLLFPKWKERGLKENAPQALEFLEKYEWSSFPDYVGIQTFPLATNRDFLLDFYSDYQQAKRRGPGRREAIYRKDFSEWLASHKTFFLEELDYPQHPRE